MCAERKRAVKSIFTMHRKIRLPARIISDCCYFYSEISYYCCYYWWPVTGATGGRASQTSYGQGLDANLRKDQVSNLERGERASAPEPSSREKLLSYGGY